MKFAMRIKSLLLTLTLGIVGSSSVALADHDDYRTSRFDSQLRDQVTTSYRDHDHDCDDDADDCFNIDLDGDGRRIDKIFVDGRSRDGTFPLYAM